jgi:hypothetical protein
VGKMLELEAGSKIGNKKGNGTKWTDIVIVLTDNRICVEMDDTSVSFLISERNTYSEISGSHSVEVKVTDFRDIVLCCHTD